MSCTISLILVEYKASFVVHTVWNAWGAWSQCSVSCGMGSHNRLRTCNGQNCTGYAEEILTCQRKQCPGMFE